MAILCNHQRAVPKGHSGQMEKLEARLLELQTELDALSADYRAAQRAKNAAKAESCAPAPCPLPPVMPGRGLRSSMGCTSCSCLTAAARTVGLLANFDLGRFLSETP